MSEVRKEGKIEEKEEVEFNNDDGSDDDDDGDGGSSPLSARVAVNMARFTKDILCIQSLYHHRAHVSSVSFICMKFPSRH
jgi:hypothetical protein